MLITGGVSGIGAASVTRFLEEGCEVGIFDRDAAGLRRVRQQHPALGPALAVDVSDQEAVVAAYDRLLADWGIPEIVINNAGISIRHSFLEISPAEWRSVLATNLDGVFFVAQEAARHMLSTGRGVIINMSSTNALVGHPRYADYNASKAAVLELTRSMALELAPRIRVIAVCPGYVLTPMQKAEYTPEMLAAVNARIPLARHARPEEIAALFAFLASDEVPYITGQPVIVDGGETAGGLASRD